MKSVEPCCSRSGLIRVADEGFARIARFRPNLVFCLFRFPLNLAAVFDKRRIQGNTKRMTKSISIRVEEKLIESVDQLRKQEGRDRSEVIREALQLWLRDRRLEGQVRSHLRGYEEHPISNDEFEPVLGAQQWPK